jgi:hypothetical protein
LFCQPNKMARQNPNIPCDCANFECSRRVSLAYLLYSFLLHSTQNLFAPSTYLHQLFGAAQKMFESVRVSLPENHNRVPLIVVASVFTFLGSKSISTCFRDQTNFVFQSPDCGIEVLRPFICLKGTSRCIITVWIFTDCRSCLQPCLRSPPRWEFAMGLGYLQLNSPQKT